MDDYKERLDTITVPPNTGIDGFLRTIRTLLKLPRVQEIRIDARGQVTCRRYARAGDLEVNSGVDFAGLSPGDIVRNTHVEEVSILPGYSAASVIGALLDTVAERQLSPIAFASGEATVLWHWYEASNGGKLRNREYLHGLPLYLDRDLPETALVLIAGLGQDAALVDARRSFKVEIPDVPVETKDAI